MSEPASSSAMSEPNKENIAKWVAALRSTTNTQGRSRLRKGNDRCCLGVACDVAMENGVDMSVDSIGRYYTGDSDGSSTVLPWNVAQWLGFHDSDPVIAESDDDDDSEFISATRANDDLHWSFLRIAEAIEVRYLR